MKNILRMTTASTAMSAIDFLAAAQGLSKLKDLKNRAGSPKLNGTG